jgi:hypothetical protein
MKSWKIELLLFYVLIALFAACSPTRIAGNGSEITNGVVVSETGPADSALVIAFPVSYIPCTRRNAAAPETTFTDVQGAFNLRLADTAWNLLIYDRTRQLGAFAPRLQGEPAMGIIRLDSLGAIAGEAAALTIDASKQTFIGIAGSPFVTKVVKDSSFLIIRVPPYSYRISLWIYSTLWSMEPILERDTVITGATVSPGRTTSIILNH